jgi:MraZ protein
MEQERKISEKALRYLHRNALQVSPDSQGRILLSRELLDYAEIQKSAVIVGCSSYAEIWSAENWRAELDSEDNDEISRELERFGL